MMIGAVIGLLLYTLGVAAEVERSQAFTGGTPNLRSKETRN